MRTTKRPRRPYWGVCTLVFLGLAMSGVLTSNTQGRYTGLTLAMVLVGLSAAAVATLFGLRQRRATRR